MPFSYVQHWVFGKRNSNDQTVLAKTSIILLPGETKILPVQPQNIHTYQENFSIIGSNEDILDHDGLHVYSMYHEKNSLNEYNIIVKNNSHLNMAIVQGDQVGYLINTELNLYKLCHLSTLDPQKFKTEQNFNPYDYYLKKTQENFDDFEDLHLCKINMTENQQPTAEANADTPDYLIAKDLATIQKENETRAKNEAIKKAKTLIDEDDNLSEEEKEEALKQFIENGYVAKSASQVTEQNKHVTELKSATTPLSDEEIIAQINVEHLSQENQTKVLNLCKQFIDIFPKHEFDFESNNLSVYLQGVP